MTYSAEQLSHFLLNGYCQRYSQDRVPNPIIHIIGYHYCIIYTDLCCLFFQNLTLCDRQIINMTQHKACTIKTHNIDQHHPPFSRLYVWKSSQLFYNVKLPQKMKDTHENYLHSNNNYHVLFWKKSNMKDPHFSFNPDCKIYFKMVVFNPFDYSACYDGNILQIEGYELSLSKWGCSEVSSVFGGYLYSNTYGFMQIHHGHKLTFNLFGAIKKEVTLNPNFSIRRKLVRLIDKNHQLYINSKYMHQHYMIDLNKLELGVDEFAMKLNNTMDPHLISCVFYDNVNRRMYQLSENQSDDILCSFYDLNSDMLHELPSLTTENMEYAKDCYVWNNSLYVFTDQSITDCMGAMMGHSRYTGQKCSRLYCYDMRCNDKWKDVTKSQHPNYTTRNMARTTSINTHFTFL
eukprot:95221_1